MDNVITFDKFQSEQKLKEMWDDVYVDFSGDLSDIILLWNQGIIYDLEHLNHMREYKQKMKSIVKKTYTDSEWLNLMECEFKKRRNRKDLQKLIEKNIPILEKEFEKVKDKIPDVDQIVSYDHTKLH